MKFEAESLRSLEQRYGAFKGFSVRLIHKEVMYEGKSMEVMGLHGI